MPTLPHANAMLGAIILSEAGSEWGRLLAERRDRVGLELRVYLELSKLVSARQYLAAQRLRTRLYEEMLAAFATVDLLATPATLLPAPRVGDLMATVGGDEVSVVEAICRFTGPFNLTGLPALALPCGLTRDGLPIGLQLVGRPFAEADLLAVGDAYQRATDWQARLPPN